jgi:hypothetical protein
MPNVITTLPGVRVGSCVPTDTSLVTEFLWKPSLGVYYKSTTLIQSNTTQVYLNSVCYPYAFATYFGLYLGGYPQACQYKNHTKEGTIKI